MSDPFSEFGGAPLDEQKDQFAEFGGTAIEVQPPAPEARTAEAILQGVGQGYTFGFLPWLQARSEQAANAVANIAGGDRPTDFNRLRSEWVARNDALRDENTAAFIGGNIGGAILNPVNLAMAGGAIPGTLGAAVKGGALLGARQGAIQGLGEMTSRDQGAGTFLANVGAGAAGGALGGAAGLGIQKVGGAIRDTAAGIIPRLLGANKAKVRELGRAGPGALNAVAADIVDSRVMTPFSGTEAMMDRAGSLIGSRGGVVDDILQSVDDARPQGFDPLDVVAAIERRAAETARAGEALAGPGYASTMAEKAAAAAETAQLRGQSGAMPLADVNSYLKRPMGDAVGRVRRMVSEPEGAKKAVGDAYSTVRRYIEDQAEATLGAGAGQQLRSANQGLGRALDMKDMLAERFAREGANNGIRLGDQMAMGGGIASGGVAGGLAGMATNKALQLSVQPMAVAAFRGGRALAGANFSPIANVAARASTMQDEPAAVEPYFNPMPGIGAAPGGGGALTRYLGDQPIQQGSEEDAIEAFRSDNARAQR